MLSNNQRAENKECVGECEDASLRPFVLCEIASKNYVSFASSRESSSAPSTQRASQLKSCSPVGLLSPTGRGASHARPQSPFSAPQQGVKWLPPGELTNLSVAFHRTLKYFGTTQSNTVFVGLFCVSFLLSEQQGLSLATLQC